MAAVGALVTSGAQAVKLEGVDGHEDVDPTHRRLRRSGHGPHRPDAAVGQSARRLPRAGQDARTTRAGCSARRTRSRTRLLLDRARVRARGARRPHHVGADDPDDRHRRRRRHRRTGPRAAGPLGPRHEPPAAVRPPLPRRRAGPDRCPRTSTTPTSRRSGFPSPRRATRDDGLRERRPPGGASVRRRRAPG